MAVCPAIPVNHERMCMKLILALVVATLTACGGGSSTPETTAVAGGTTTPTTPTPTPAPTPSPTPSPTPTPTPAPTPSESIWQKGLETWGKFRCAGCHGGNFPGASNPALIMSSMQTVVKHKEAYGTTAISGWGLTVSQEDADNMAVFAADPRQTPAPCTPGNCK